MLGLLAAQVCACRGDAPPAVQRARSAAIAKLTPGKLDVGPEAMPAAWPVRDEPRPEPSGPRTLVLVIADGVRADRTSLCGYDLPTTPHLDRLASGPFVRWRCDGEGVAANALLPALGTLWTGLPAPAHGLTGPGAAIHPEVPVLPEQLREAGYHTVLVSSSPAARESTGLWRGFDRVESAEDWRDRRRTRSWEGPFGLTVAQAGERPLLIVAVLSQARSPFLPVPPAHPWAQPQGSLQALPPGRPHHPTWQLWRGEGDEGAQRRWAAAWNHGYDHGVSLVDARLGEIFRALVRAGRQDDLRAVVVGTHEAPLPEDRSGPAPVALPLVWGGGSEAPSPRDGPDGLPSVPKWLARVAGVSLEPVPGGERVQHQAPRALEPEAWEALGYVVGDAAP